MAFLPKLFALPAVIFVFFYRWFVSPLLPQCCRFLPTCSAYAIEALEKHGIFQGSVLTVRRILKCHPWGAKGFDPVPTTEEFERHE